jgi:hypothetical protein
MTQGEYITVVDVRPVPKIVPMEDAFEFREDRPARWLQRACLWVLRKLGCYAAKEVIEYQRHHIGRDGERFMMRLMRAKASIQGAFAREPQRLLIGSEQYAELMEETLSNSYFAFEAQSFWGNGPGRPPTIVGLTVEVIPWMRGMLLLPVGK